MAEWSANYIKDRILRFNPTADRPFVLGLPTGGTPVKTYAILAKFYKAGELSFKHVVTFNMVRLLACDKTATCFPFEFLSVSMTFLVWCSLY